MLLGTAVLWHHAAAGGGGHEDLGGHLRSDLRRAAVDRSLYVGELGASENKESHSGLENLGRNFHKMGFFRFKFFFNVFQIVYVNIVSVGFLYDIMINFGKHDR